MNVPLLPRLLVLALAAGALQARPAPAPPNIVFIFSDDHAAPAISAYGDARKLIVTPNLDRIGAEGMRFERCLVTNSICGPSRATVLTGKYSHKNGFYGNHGAPDFDGSQVTFPKLLRQAGYQTALIGKWHLGSAPTGFDFWQILLGQGIYYDAPMIRNGAPVKTAGYVTTALTDLTLDWLERRDPAKPFLLMMQHKAPHRPWEPDVTQLGFDHDRVYPEPSNLLDDYANRGSAVRDQDMSIARTMGAWPKENDLKFEPAPNLTPEQLRLWHGYYGPRNAAFRAANLTGDALVRWKYQRYMHDYLACIRSVDESVGRVLRYLDEHGLAENTIVVYSSDQGFFLGEHGWFDKRWIFEESLRTPLLVRWPGHIRPGSVNRDLVSNLDFAETFLAAAHVPVPADMQGASLLPLFTGNRPADWREAFYYHYYEYPQPHRVAPHYGVVTDRYKLVRFLAPGGTYTELYDLQQDPREMRDASGQPGMAAVRADLEARLATLRARLEVPEDAPAPTHAETRPAP